jgi:hypothetical protein
MCEKSLKVILTAFGSLPGQFYSEWYGKKNKVVTQKVLERTKPGLRGWRQKTTSPLTHVAEFQRSFYINLFSSLFHAMSNFQPFSSYSGQGHHLQYVCNKSIGKPRLLSIRSLTERAEKMRLVNKKSDQVKG